MTTFNINITADAIIDSSVSNKEIGQAIKAERLRKKLTALKLTQSIGIGVTALKKYEEGDGKLSNIRLAAFPLLYYTEGTKQNAT